MNFPITVQPPPRHSGWDAGIQVLGPAPIVRRFGSTRVRLDPASDRCGAGTAKTAGAERLRSLHIKHYRERNRPILCVLWDIWG